MMLPTGTAEGLGPGCASAPNVPPTKRLPPKSAKPQATDRCAMSSDILIVDDEADIRELVAGILQDEGHGTRTAKNSDQALAAIAARRPNLVFLDIWLQGSKLDCLQMLRAIQQDNTE